MENTPPQENVISDYVDEIHQIEQEGHELAVRKARRALFWAGGLFIFWELIGMFRTYGEFEPTIFIIALVEGGIFIALAFWTRKKPFTAVVIGLCYFIALIIFSAIVYGKLQGSEGVFKSLFSGIIVKAIIICNLIIPLGPARELQRLKANNSQGLE